jgi:hypothetical protein
MYILYFGTKYIFFLEEIYYMLSKTLFIKWIFQASFNIKRKCWFILNYRNNFNTKVGQLETANGFMEFLFSISKFDYMFMYYRLTENPTWAREEENK